MLNLLQAVAGSGAPPYLIRRLTLRDVRYVDFDGHSRSGQLLVHVRLAREVEMFFRHLFDHRFPIADIRPIVAFDWDDDASMRANNTSGFNYRTIAGTEKLSLHAVGCAIDVNPAQNPCCYANGLVSPPGTVRDINVPGTLTEELLAPLLSRGWEWGGHWSDPKDWHHLQKRLR